MGIGKFWGCFAVGCLVEQALELGLTDFIDL